MTEEKKNDKAMLKRTTRIKAPIKPVSMQGVASLAAPLQRQALREFKEWKQSIVDTVRRKSAIEVYADGTYKFVLPASLVEVFWHTSITEAARIKLGGRPLADDDESRAAVTETLRELREEVRKAIAKKGPN